MVVRHRSRAPECRGRSQSHGKRRTAARARELSSKVLEGTRVRRARAKRQEGGAIVREMRMTTRVAAIMWQSLDDRFAPSALAHRFVSGAPGAPATAVVRPSHDLLEQRPGVQRAVLEPRRASRPDDARDHCGARAHRRRAAGKSVPVLRGWPRGDRRHPVGAGQPDGRRLRCAQRAGHRLERPLMAQPLRAGALACGACRAGVSSRGRSFQRRSSPARF